MNENMRTEPGLTDRILFRSTDWQLFLAFVAVWVLEVALDVSIFYVSQVMYMIILGMTLRDHLPDRYQRHYRNFLVAGVALIVSLIFFLNYAKIFGPVNNVVVIIMTLLMIVSYNVYASFVARAIRSLETQDRAKFKDYFIDMLWVGAFCPLGVWMLQPRLNVLGKQLHKV